MRTDFFRHKSVLITGASAGIGEELAWQLANAGATLTLTARRRDLLDRLAARITSAGHVPPVVVDGDVTSDADLQRAVKAGVERWGRLDVVIANAGFAVVGELRDLSLADYQRQLDVNLFGVLRTIYAALPEIEKAKGNVVIIGSVAGWIASPGASAYAMSKFALRALATSLAVELRHVGVTVTLISPGFIVSSIRQVDNQDHLRASARDWIPAWIVVPTDKAVRQMLGAVARGDREAIITGHGKLLVALERWAPWVVRALSRRVRRPGPTPSR